METIPSPLASRCWKVCRGRRLEAISKAGDTPCRGWVHFNFAPWQECPEKTFGSVWVKLVGRMGGTSGTLLIDVALQQKPATNWKQGRRAILGGTVQYSTVQQYSVS